MSSFFRNLPITPQSGALKCETMATSSGSFAIFFPIPTFFSFPIAREIKLFSHQV